MNNTIEINLIEKIENLEYENSILYKQKSDYLIELDIRKKQLFDANNKIKILEKCIIEMPIYAIKMGYKYDLKRDIWLNDKLRGLSTFEFAEILCQEFIKSENL